MLAELASVQMPTILIGALLGSMRLGYFTMAWRIVELASFLIITPVRTAALPAFAARRGQLKGRIDPLFLDTLRLVGFLAIPAFVGLAAVAQETVLLFGGPNWWQAAPALAMLALYGIPLCLGKIEEAYAFAHGRARELATLSGASAIVVSIGLLLALGLAHREISRSMLVPSREAQLRAQADVATQRRQEAIIIPLM